MLKIIPLGGLGEIGLNMMAFEYGDSLLVVDAGLMFPEDYMLGIDYVIPDMGYLKKNRSKLVGIVLTHAHEDHIGTIPYLLREIKAPVYATPFTLGMVRHKLEEHDLLTNTRLVEIHPGIKISLGVFELDFIRVAHSVVDGVGIALRTPVGLIVHTGDFKISHTNIKDMETDLGRFAQLGEEGVLALLSDSTNVEKDGYTISDQQVGETLRNIASQSPGRMIIALFASSISRIQQIINIAVATGRKVVINGKSIEISTQLAKELGYLHVPDDIEIDIGDLDAYSEEETLIITTGSQGEPMSALARMAGGNHKYIKIQPEDTVILSSKFIPGNEKAIANIINNIYRRGANVIYEKISAIHVSGHAFREELKMMIQLTKPRYFIPIHGEYRHLVHHARLAKMLGIPDERVLLAENGQIIQFDDTGGKIGQNITTGRVLIDGKGIGDVGRSVLKERRTLSEEGLVMVSMVFDEETGIVIYGPEIVSKGFVFETETGHLLEDAICVVLEIVEEVDPDVSNRIARIRALVTNALRKYFYFTIGRRPVILAFIQEI
ncbi:MAG: ribonuclease J [Desulfobacterales bacterium]